MQPSISPGGRRGCRRGVGRQRLSLPPIDDRTGEGGDGRRRDHRAMTLDPAIAARVKRNADGLFTAVVQERSSGDVLMVAWMDDDALARTLETREGTYFSRSRGAQWVKGATSGHTQQVHAVRWIATATRCCWSSIRSARRVTPATTAASTPTCCWNRSKTDLRTCSMNWFPIRFFCGRQDEPQLPVAGGASTDSDDVLAARRQKSEPLARRRAGIHSWVFLHRPTSRGYHLSEWSRL